MKYLGFAFLALFALLVSITDASAVVCAKGVYRAGCAGPNGAVVARRFRAMGIRDKPIAPGSPWQNGFAERLIGSIRRECVDHLVVLGEAHLRQILTKYAAYYNELRTHRSLNKDAPIRRAIQHVGRIVSAPVLGGLHHHYCRI